MGQAAETVARKYKTMVLPERTWMWCVAWKTPSMPAAAFWYFHSEDEASQAIARLKRGKVS